MVEQSQRAPSSVEHAHCLSPELESAYAVAKRQTLSPSVALPTTTLGLPGSIEFLASLGHQQAVELLLDGQLAAAGVVTEQLAAAGVVTEQLAAVGVEAKQLSAGRPGYAQFAAVIEEVVPGRSEVVPAGPVAAQHYVEDQQLVAVIEQIVPGGSDAERLDSATGRGAATDTVAGVLASVEAIHPAAWTAVRLGAGLAESVECASSAPEIAGAVAFGGASRVDEPLPGGCGERYSGTSATPRPSPRRSDGRQPGKIAKSKACQRSNNRRKSAYMVIDNIYACVSTRARTRAHTHPTHTHTRTHTPPHTRTQVHRHRQTKQLCRQKHKHGDNIGLTSAKSQLDRNAWQHVATYKSGSKQTWRQIFSVWKHVEKAHMDRTKLPQPSFHFAEQLQPGFSTFLQVQTPCCIQSSCTTSFIEPYRSSTARALLPWRRHRGQASRFLGLLFVWWTFLSLVLVGHLTGIKHETMKRRQIHHLFRHRTISMQVRGQKSAPVDRHLHDRKKSPTRHETCPYPNLFNYEALSCRKVVPCEGRKNFGK